MNPGASFPPDAPATASVVLTLDEIKAVRSRNVAEANAAQTIIDGILGLNTTDKKLLARVARHQAIVAACMSNVNACNVVLSLSKRAALPLDGAATNA